MHKIEGIVTTDDPDSRDVYINKVRDQCENYLRVAFEYYLREGGVEIPTSYPDPKTGEQSKKMDQVKILFNEDRLDPLDPFCRDMVDPDSNYGTLVWKGTIPTPVSGRKAELSISIFMIPNINHPEYTARRKKQQEHLKSAFGAGAYGLQGLYIYRNMRLIDAAGNASLEKHLRRGRPPEDTPQVGGPPSPRQRRRTADSEFRVNKSKRDITFTPRIVKALKKAKDRSKQRWHPLDPEPLLPWLQERR